MLHCFCKVKVASDPRAVELSASWEGMRNPLVMGEKECQGQRNKMCSDCREEWAPEMWEDCFISLPAPPFHWVLLLWRLQLFSWTPFSSALLWVTVNPFAGVCMGRCGCCSCYLSQAQPSEAPQRKSPELQRINHISWKMLKIMVWGCWSRWCVADLCLTCSTRNSFNDLSNACRVSRSCNEENFPVFSLYLGCFTHNWAGMLVAGCGSLLLHKGTMRTT